MPIDYLSLVHIITGTLALAGGVLALVAPKGRHWHRQGGRIFFWAMLVSAMSGSLLGLLEPERLLITALAGVLTLYLLLSSRRAARNRSGRFERMDGALFAAVVVLILLLAGLGGFALQQADGRLLGFAGEDYFMLAVMAGLGGCADVTLVFRKQMSDRHRIARHLWRMGLAFFIAVGSAFTGPGVGVFPEALRSSGLLAAPEGITALVILFWLVRTVFNRPRPVPGDAS
ncbi:DUF2306 domain-containing protein [Maricaulis sp.]|uniref:DUF2306 domain-containing protein n=1 Tax=Maricaulis sp. TaxID=1486257 RepID=UPI001B298197|nr:DUF2306 domain-containing protein [Maricaulis sp.]MBO6798371.1 DUF2306 domain-containing protein [Maricaulis sp.]